MLTVSPILFPAFCFFALPLLARLFRSSALTESQVQAKTTVYALSVGTKEVADSAVLTYPDRPVAVQII